MMNDLKSKFLRDYEKTIRTPMILYKNRDILIEQQRAEDPDNILTLKNPGKNELQKLEDSLHAFYDDIYDTTTQQIDIKMKLVNRFIESILDRKQTEITGGQSTRKLMTRIIEYDDFVDDSVSNSEDEE